MYPGRAPDRSRSPTGGDIAKELGGLPSEALLPQPGSAPSTPAIPADLAGLLAFATSDIDQFWQRSFAAQGYGYSPVTSAQGYTEPLETECGLLEIDNAAYCGLNGAVYYDLNLLAHFHADYGAFAVINVLAHEWGHHVTRELQLFARYTIQHELLADCLAGVYSRDADARGLLKQGDIEGATALFYDLGDRADVPWFDRGAHGTPTQRQQAFDQGFTQGSAVCFGLEQ